MENYPNAGFARRLAAIFYDAFFLIAIWILTILLIVAQTNEVATGLWLQLLLTAESYVFFAFFWRIKGQTLGMQVWKIKTVKSDGAVMDYPSTALRLITATLTLFPLGLIWMLVDPARLALYDRLSRTKVIYLGSKPYPSEQI